MLFSYFPCEEQHQQVPQYCLLTMVFDRTYVQKSFALVLMFAAMPLSNSYFAFLTSLFALPLAFVYSKIHKNWCTITVAPTIEHRHYIGSVTATTHQEKGIITLESNPSRGNCTTSSTRQREEVWQKCKIQKNWCTVTVAPTTEHWHYIGSVTATTHQEKRHNNTWVEPLAGNCTTSFTRQREQVWQNLVSNCALWPWPWKSIYFLEFIFLPIGDTKFTR